METRDVYAVAQFVAEFFGYAGVIDYTSLTDACDDWEEYVAKVTDCGRVLVNTARARLGENFRSDRWYETLEEAVSALRRWLVDDNQFPLLSDWTLYVDRLVRALLPCPHDTDGDGNCPHHPDGCPGRTAAAADAMNAAVKLTGSKKRRN